MTTREALEAALVVTPDDVALHSAYADFLLEAGDPRGEYIRLQLASEDSNQPADRLRQYEQAVFDLRRQHECEWLGDLWPHLQTSTTEPNVSVTWRRGWIDAIRVEQMSDALVEAVAANPFTRLLSVLAIEQNQQPVEIRTAPYEMLFEVSLVPLRRSGRFVNLRTFILGDAEGRVVADGRSVNENCKAMPRLERLQMCCDQINPAPIFGGDFDHLHTLHITSNSPRYPVAILGINDLPNLRRLYLDLVAIQPQRGELGSEREPMIPSDFTMFFETKHLNRLEHLTLRMGELADAGVEELLSSGFVNRLKGLDLCRCNITDDGARMLAAHPHIRKLEYLHLDNNLLSPIGIDDLEAAGVTVSRNQFFADGV